MTRRISYFHRRETSHGELKNIVTCAYIINMRTGQLRYGGTIYRQEHEKEYWRRTRHIDQAHNRLQNNPVIIELGPIEFRDLGFYQYRRIEHFIRKVCMPLFGVEYHQERDPYRNTSFNEKLEQIKERIFTEKLTASEEADLEEYESQFSESEDETEFESSRQQRQDGILDDFRFGILHGVLIGISFTWICLLVERYLG